jgi:hypothetical protein
MDASVRHNAAPSSVVWSIAHRGDEISLHEVGRVVI